MMGQLQYFLIVKRIFDKVNKISSKSYYEIKYIVKIIQNKGGITLIIEAILAGIYDANCYILVEQNTKECGIIDPGGDAKRLVSQIEALNAKPKFILLTHGHVDHVEGVIDLVDKYEIPFYISKTDEEYMEKDNSVFGSLPKASGYLKEGDALDLGDEIIKVIETPGHTEGGLCFLLNDDKLFTGDTLFQGSIGRTDFPGGSMAKIISSIKDKLFPLGDEVDVYPGHGDMTTIGYEKMHNPFL